MGRIEAVPGRFPHALASAIAAAFLFSVTVPLVFRFSMDVSIVPQIDFMCSRYRREQDGTRGPAVATGETENSGGPTVASSRHSWDPIAGSRTDSRAFGGGWSPVPVL
jgi:hypothetical protein